MIVGIGIDAVEIERFKQYHMQSPEKLLRIFSKKEIDYCLNEPAKSSERFAVRFAAKEAAYKALSQLPHKALCPFLTCCRVCTITINKVVNGTTLPTLTIDWKKLDFPHYETLITLTHTKQTAIAQVVLQKI